MGRIEKRIFFGVLLVLLSALGAMLFQNAFATDAPRIYRVSVLLDGAGEDYWQSFRRGVNQAAQEHNVDVRFLSRYEGEPGPAQVDALRGEWEAEADGVVLIPVDGTLLAAGLREAPSTLAVAVVGPELKGADVGCYISSDPAEMGRQLADAIIADGQSACTVYLSRGAGEAGSQRYQGLVTRLLERRIACEQVTVEPDEDFALPDGRAAVALEPEMTQALCQRSGGTSQVYGVGASNQLLHDLEEGKAAALAVQSDYDAGYLSLLSVIAQLEGERQENRVLESYVATAENMFTDPMDQILFPIG